MTTITAVGIMVTTYIVLVVIRYISDDKKYD